MNNLKTLVTVATHGDEGFSIPVVEKLANNYQFDWQINNPKALNKNKRFIGADLNRSGPGSLKSKVLEEKLAYRIIKKASKYDQIIDIHGTASNTGIFIILSDPNWQNIELAKKLNVENVVLWPSMNPVGPLTQFIPNSLEIECGPKNSAKTAACLEKVLSLFLKGEKPIVKQKYFIVTGYLKGVINKPMKDFSPTTYKGNKFVPLLVDQYKGIKCYMMQKLNNTLEY